MLSKKGGHRKCDTRLLLVRGCGDFVRVVPTFLTIARVLVLGYLLSRGVLHVVLCGVLQRFWRGFGFDDGSPPFWWPVLRGKSLSSAHLPPKKNGLLPFTSQWRTPFLCRKTKKHGAVLSCTFCDSSILLREFTLLRQTESFGFRLNKRDLFVRCCDSTATFGSASPPADSQRDCTIVRLK